ncbi:MAG: hypothetical protein NC203_07140 [Firmicutes bacterium]|nr:hypothetical protein [[Eubacterium] siraeum]MCM1488124.1 hypothetical protein [Bacillota bacterium]
MKFGKTTIYSLKAIILACLMLLSCACADTPEENFYDSEEYFYDPEENFYDSEEKARWRSEYYHTLDYAVTDEEKSVSMTPEELKTADFSGCSVDVLDEYGLRIYERLTEEKTQKFVEMLAQADIGEEEYEVEWQKANGMANPSQFQLAFNNGDLLNIGVRRFDDDTIYFIINGEHEYLCDEETKNNMADFWNEAYTKFEYSVRAAYVQDQKK